MLTLTAHTPIIQGGQENEKITWQMFQWNIDTGLNPGAVPGGTGHGLRFPERGRDMALVLVWTRFRGLFEFALLSDGLIYFHA